MKLRPPGNVAVEFRRPDGTRLWLRGKTARILQLLLQHPEGITAAGVFPVTTGLSEFVSDLRSRHRIKIGTTLEPNFDGVGRHARYRLECTIRIIIRKERDDG